MMKARTDVMGGGRGASDTTAVSESLPSSTSTSSLTLTSTSTTSTSSSTPSRQTTTRRLPESDTSSSSSSCRGDNGTVVAVPSISDKGTEEQEDVDDDEEEGGAAPSLDQPFQSQGRDNDYCACSPCALEGLDPPLSLSVSAPPPLSESATAVAVAASAAASATPDADGDNFGGSGGDVALSSSAEYESATFFRHGGNNNDSDGGNQDDDVDAGGSCSCISSSSNSSSNNRYYVNEDPTTLRLAPKYVHKVLRGGGRRLVRSQVGPYAAAQLGMHNNLALALARQTSDDMEGNGNGNGIVTKTATATATATATTQEEDVSSNNNNNNNNKNIVPIRHSQVTLGKLLGQGSFSSVYVLESLSSLLSPPTTTGGEGESGISSSNNCDVNVNVNSDGDGDIHHRHDDNEGCDDCSRPPPLVVKVLRRTLLDRPSMLAACAADLVKEGAILACLQQDGPGERSSSSSSHPNNIVRLYGWAPSLLAGFANGRHDSFFLVMERLEGTLHDQLKEWRRLSEEKDAVDVAADDDIDEQRRDKANRGGLLGRLLLRGGTGRRGRRPGGNSGNQGDGKQDGPFDYDDDDDDGSDFWLHRLQLLLDLACAVEFMHSRRILHRDLKPDNCGVVVAGDGGTAAAAAAGQRNGCNRHRSDHRRPPLTLKVFDFDVARVLPPTHSDDANATFHLTKRVGSPRYMSPEVARGDPYNAKADVYTAGLLVHEVLTLEKPYGDVPSHLHDALVFAKGGRGVRPNLPGVAARRPSSWRDDDPDRTRDGPRRRLGRQRQRQPLLLLLSTGKKAKNGRTGVKQLQQQQQQQHPSSSFIAPHFWTDGLRRLVTSMWTDDVSSRPTMEHVTGSLRREYQAVETLREQKQQDRLHQERIQQRLQLQQQQHQEEQQQRLLLLSSSSAAAAAAAAPVSDELGVTKHRGEQQQQQRPACSGWHRLRGGGWRRPPKFLPQQQLDGSNNHDDGLLLSSSGGRHRMRTYSTATTISTISC